MLVSVFNDSVKILEEKQRNSVIEVINIIDGATQKLCDRIESKFLPLNNLFNKISEIREK